MKNYAIVLLGLAFAGAVSAQNPPPAGAGQPPKSGQITQPGQPPKGGYPDPSWMPQPGQPGQPGQPPKGGYPDPSWMPQKCEKQIPRLKKAAEGCLRIKKGDKRGHCFESLQGKFPPGFMDSCKAQIEPLKMEIQAKEKEMYPNQQTSMGDQGQGGQPGQPQPGQPQPGQLQPGKDPKAKVVDCAKLALETRKHADQCIKTKDAGKRKACFDQIGQKIQDSGAGESCASVMDPMKEEYKAKEAQMYPGQPSSFN